MPGGAGSMAGSEESTGTSTSTEGLNLVRSVTPGAPSSASGEVTWMTGVTMSCDVLLVTVMVTSPDQPSRRNVGALTVTDSAVRPGVSSSPTPIVKLFGSDALWPPEVI